MLLFAAALERDQMEEVCKCNGWKTSAAPAPNNAAPPPSNPTDPCRSCGHTMTDHISHLIGVAEDELNALLSVVVDVENLFVCVNKEEDPDNKQVRWPITSCSPTFHRHVRNRISSLKGIVNNTVSYRRPNLNLVTRLRRPRGA